MTHVSDSQASLYNWDEFRALLLARFQAVNSARHARDQLANPVQSGSVRAYATKMQKLAMQIPDIGEGKLKDRFIRGLKRRTQEQVVMQDPDTFEKGVKLADPYDSLWDSANLFSNTRRTPSSTWTTSANFFLLERGRLQKGPRSPLILLASCMSLGLMAPQSPTHTTTKQAQTSKRTTTDTDHTTLPATRQSLKLHTKRIQKDSTLNVTSAHLGGLAKKPAATSCLKARIISSRRPRSIAKYSCSAIKRRKR
jgi:hypothetical protein